MVLMDLFAGQKYRHRCREQPCGPGWGEEESGLSWEIGIDIYSLPCVKQVTSGKLPCSRGSSAWCSVMTSREGGVGGRFSREGTYVHL